ncbi:MAG: response regulator [Desulfobacula sp.]|jgi:signal transduction histidine kinase/ActR/RegA family two-component response regulator|nr:response regulator [Desulfobacula sp.]
MNITTHLLGDILLSMEALSRDHLDEALKFQRHFLENKEALTSIENSLLLSNSGVPKLGEILLYKKYISEGQLPTALKLQTKRVKDLSSIDSKKLATALELGFLINSTLDLDEVLYLIMTYADLVTSSMASTLMLYDKETHELVFSFPTGLKAKKIKDVRIPEGTGIVGWVAQHQEYALVKDTQKDPRFYAGIDTVTGCETKSLLCVPMKSKNNFIGVLEVINKTNGSDFTENDALLLSIFAQQAAMAIEKARLFTALEERLKQEKTMQAELARAEKLHVIGTLAGGIAHDFNNILFPIIGHTEMLLSDTPEDSPSKRSLNEIYSSSLRAKDLVKQILTFSRQESSELQLMKMQPIIKEALKLIRSTIPSTIEIKHDIQTDCGVIKADPTQIHQIVMNLATNAYHAMEKTGGELKVSLKKVELGNYDVITPDMIPGEYVCLTVSDTGTGIDKVITEKIFDPFFTTKAIGKGTGMGLSVIHGIVIRMGGAIQVHSKPGKGAQFQVYLPAEKSLLEEQVTNSNAEIQSGTEHILLIDDEEAILTMEKKLLERLGYQVTSQIISVEALEVFRANSNKFDLVITDMQMPNMSGDKLSAELVKINPDIPVLLCTGYNEAMSEEKAFSMGIKGFLLKPIVLKDLSQKIREVLDSNKNENTN